MIISNADHGLMLKILAAPLIIKGFVKGEKKCNYEHYLLELVNKSSFFLKLSQGEFFHPPTSEEDGQCDCISSHYELDFKLIASKTILQAKSIFSYRQSLIQDGVVLTSAPRKANSSMKATRIHSALRKLNLQQLYELREKHPKKQGIDNDICELLSTLETRKNLLLFFPYEFYYKTNVDFSVGLCEIQKGLQGDFGTAMKYRADHVPDKDTYFVFVFQNKFVVLQVADFECIEIVETKEIPTYTRLYNDYCDWL